MHKLIYCIPFGLLCIACTAGPDYKGPGFYSDAEIKNELGLKKAYVVPKNWYAQLNDEQLNQLVALGLQNSTDIASATFRLQQARANLSINAVQYLPMVNARGGYNYEKNSKKIGPAVDTHYYSAGFDASWELDLWGKGRRQTEADIAVVKGQEYTLDNIKTTVAAEVASHYVNVMMNAEKLRIAERNLVLQSDIFETVRQKYESGLTDDIAYNQARYLVETTRVQIPALKSNIETYKNALATLIGVLPSQLPLDVHKKSPLFAGQYKYNTDMLYNLPADIVRRRPDVAAAEQNLIAQNALVGKAVAALYPDVSITALWGYASQGGTHLFSSRSQTYNYAPVVSLPLLDWNSLQNNIKVQKYIKAEALAQYKQTVLNAVGELKNAMTAYQNEIKSNRSQAQALANMRQVVASSTSRYNNGLLEFSDLLTTEQNLLSAQNNYVESKGQIFQNLIAYYKASGGGY